MKKIFLTIASVLLTTGVFADEKSDALLSALAKKVAGWGNYRVEFSVTIENQVLTGNYEVSGTAWSVTTPDIELYSDGATKYEVNLADREVIVDRVDPNDKSVLSNPTRLFDFLDGSYTHRYVGAAIINGVACERVEITETATGQKTEAYIATATGLPVRLSYGIAFMNTDAVIDVVRITPNLALDRASFSYDPARYAGYDIIDFR